MPNTAVNRRFGSLLLLSLALHGSLFALINRQRQTLPAELPPLLASLRQLAAPPSGATAAQPPAAVLPPKARPLPQRESPKISRSDAAAGPTTRLPAANPSATARAEQAAERLVDTPGPAAPPAPPESTPERPSPDHLAAYRQRLSELLARQQAYPRIAALRGWEGEVRLRLKVARKGNLLGVVLDRSSGFAVLDQHALAMLASFGNLPPLPEALESNEIQVVVPIHYKLNKTT